jgi:hypothetical protein
VTSGPKSEIFEAALAQELNDMMAVKKFERIVCSTIEDVALALRMVTKQLCPFLDNNLRAEFIDWYCGCLGGVPQDLVFVLRKPILRPRAEILSNH